MGCQDERDTVQAGVDVTRLRELEAENARLRGRLSETERDIRAVRRGEVDAFLLRKEREDRVCPTATSQDAYRAFVEHMREGAVIAAEDGTILYSNRRLTDMVASSPGGLAGVNLLDQVAPEDSFLVDALLRRARGRESSAEVSLVGSLGERVPVRLSAFPVDLEGILALCLLVEGSGGRR